MLDLTKEECKIVKQALDSHVGKLAIDKSRLTSSAQKKQIDERINDVHRVRRKVITQSNN